MNTAYLDNGKTVFVTNEDGCLKKRDRTASLDEILVQENVVEEIENQLEKVEGELTSNNDDLKLKQIMFRLTLASTLFNAVVGILLFLLSSPLDAIYWSIFGAVFSGACCCITKEISNLIAKNIQKNETLCLFLKDCLSKEQTKLENLKEQALLEEKENMETIVKEVDDKKQIHEIRNFLIILAEYIRKVKRFSSRKGFTPKERNQLAEEGVDVHLLETYLLTFSNRKNKR